MQTVSLSDFKPIDAKFPDIRFLREEERLCCTRYLLVDEKRHQTLLIDSGDGKDRLDFIPDSVFLTHGHFDHTLGVRPEWPEVWIHPAEDPRQPHVKIPDNAKPLVGQRFEFGQRRFLILHTPGHTSGSMCLFEETSRFLFSGDTKFASGGMGRTDLGGSDEQMRESLELLEQLPWTLLGPGHGWLERRDGKIF